MEESPIGVCLFVIPTTPPQEPYYTNYMCTCETFNLAIGEFKAIHVNMINVQTAAAIQISKIKMGCN